LNLIRLLVTVLLMAAYNTFLIAQSVPSGINYQAVARDANGDELINRSIDVRLSVISGSPDGEVEWEEVHSEVITSQFGLFNIIIGQGICSSGTVTSFEDIPWGDDLHFLKVEIKFDSEYLTMGTMQFLSVPYALFAQKSLESGPQGPPGPAGDPATDDQILTYDPQSHILSLENDDNPVDLSGLINDADADVDNELQILNLTGNKLQIKTLSDSTLINSVDIDASTVNEIQNLSIQGHQLSLSQGNSISLPDSVIDEDANPLNEIQDLHIEGNVLYITRNSDSTRIDFSPYLDNTDEQYLSLTKNLLSIENGDTVVLNYNDTSAVNEIQDLSFAGNILKVTNNPAATDIDLSVYLDNTDQQSISLDTDTLRLTNGGKVFIGGYLDNTDQQNLSLEGNLLKIDNGNSVALDYNDISPTNELQILSISNDTIYLSSGGEVYLGGYLDNTDQQGLNLVGNSLSIDNGNTVELNYNDTSPTNELITGAILNGTDLEITDEGGTTTVPLSSLENIPLIGFRAKKTKIVPVPTATDTTFLFNDVVEYNDGGGYDPLTGIFTAPSDGVYVFHVNYDADGSAQKLYIYMNEVLYETLNDDIGSPDMVSSAILIKLLSDQTVRIVLYTGIPNSSGTGSFSGFRIH